MLSMDAFTRCAGEGSWASGCRFRGTAVISDEVTRGACSLHAARDERIPARDRRRLAQLRDGELGRRDRAVGEREDVPKCVAVGGGGERVVLSAYSRDG